MQEIPEKPEFKTGLYRHYKGNLYWASGLGLTTSALEWHVKYKRYDEPSNYEWLRSLSEWNQIIDNKPRFEYIVI